MKQSSIMIFTEPGLCEGQNQGKIGVKETRAWTVVTYNMHQTFYLAVHEMYILFEKNQIEVLDLNEIYLNFILRMKFEDPLL
jgi:hypothetical protein